jgi:hypothetical protein
MTMPGGGNGAGACCCSGVPFVRTSVVCALVKLEKGLFMLLSPGTMVVVAEKLVMTSAPVPLAEVTAEV